MSILRSYKVNSYRRICDICGRPRQIEDIRFSDGVAICRDHPQFRTAQQLNRLNARVRPTRVLPVPHPKPLAPVDTWTAEESQIFNFVCRYAPFDVVDVTANAGAIVGPQSYVAGAWALIYLCKIVLEDKRPGTWMTLARTKIASLADFFIAHQAIGAARNLGGFDQFAFTGTNHIYAEQDASLALAGLCLAYQTNPDGRYLAAAKLAAGFLVGLQAANLATSGARATFGPPASSYNSGTNTYGTTINPSSLLALWAMSLLKGIAGDITVGPLVPNNFTSDPGRTLSTAISQIRAFWETGYGGVNGFSAATPFSTFSATSLAWQNNTNIPSYLWGAGIFALAEVDGVTPQLTALWTYLRTLTGSGIDATVAPAITYNAVTGLNTSTLYSLWAAGLMAKVTASLDRGALKALKDILSVPRARQFATNTPVGAETLYLGPLGSCSATFNPTSNVSGTIRFQEVQLASQVGLVYRQQPQGFLGQGH